MTEEKKKGLIFIGAIVLQILIVLTIVIFKFSTVANGTPVLLRVIPVDPYDMLRGNYLVLRYDISTLDRSYFPQNTVNGQIVYVGLKKEGEYYHFGGLPIITSIPQNRSGDILYIKGRVISGGEQTGGIGIDYARGGQVNVSYDSGEEFFIPEGSGNRLPPGNISALLKVNDQGGAVLEKVLVDGKEFASK